MTTTEVRLALLEGQVMEQSQLFTDTRNALARLEQRVETGFGDAAERFAQIDRRFDQVDVRLGQIDNRLDQVDVRLDQVDARLDQIDRRLDRMDDHFERMEARFDRHDGRLSVLEERMTSLSLLITQEVGSLRKEMSTDFRWIAKIQITTLVSVVVALLGVAISR